MRKSRNRRRSRRRRSRKMRGGMFGIGDMFAKAGNMLGITRPQGEDKEEDPNRPKSPVSETPSMDVAKESAPVNMDKQDGSVPAENQVGGKKRRRRRKSKKRGGGCGCAAPMTGGKRKRRRRTRKKKRKSRRRRR